MGVAEASITWLEGAPVKCDFLHDLAKIDATFDDPNLVSRAGLVPVMALALRAVNNQGPGKVVQLFMIVYVVGAGGGRGG